MTPDNRYLNLSRAAAYIGQTTRWMRRHWPTLLKNGVKVMRVPANKGPKGRLFFERVALDAYMASCEIKADAGLIDHILGS